MPLALRVSMILRAWRCRLIVLAVGSCSSIACSTSSEYDEGSDVGDPLDFPVDSTGPFGVGYRIIELTYIPGPLGTPRTLPVHLWYPTWDTCGRDPIIDASLAESPYADGKYPVHIFSHGRASFAGAADPLMTAFASHGWVAVAPDHVGSTWFDNVEPSPLWKYYTRPLDLTAVLDHLDVLPESDPLSGKLETSAVVMSGHSSGVFTSWAISGASFDVPSLEARCERDTYAGGCTSAEIDAFAKGFRDSRVVTTIPMAGRLNSTWLGPTGYRSVDIPMLAMSASEDTVDALGQFEIVEGLDFTWIDIEGACHQTFTYAGCPNIDDAEGQRIVATYALAFARHHVLGDDDPLVLGLLDGSIEISPLVAFARR